MISHLTEDRTVQPRLNYVFVRSLYMFRTKVGTLSLITDHQFQWLSSGLRPIEWK